MASEEAQICSMLLMSSWYVIVAGKSGPGRQTQSQEGRERAGHRRLALLSTILHGLVAQKCIALTYCIAT